MEKIPNPILSSFFKKSKTQPPSTPPQENALEISEQFF